MADLSIGLACMEVKPTLDEQFQHMASYVKKAKVQGVDILCFPEFALGHGAEDADYYALSDYQRKITEMAQGIQIIYGGVRYEGDRCYDTCFVCHDGVSQHYDKIYLGERERLCFTAGQEVKLFTHEAKGVPFACLLCYDMHFPELSAKASRAGAEIIIAPHRMLSRDAKYRVSIWQKYMGARAYDNRVYTLAVNGMMGGRGGGAGVWDMDGNLVACHDDATEDMLTVSIDLDELRGYRDPNNTSMRKRFFLKDDKEFNQV